MVVDLLRDVLGMKFDSDIVSWSSRGGSIDTTACPGKTQLLVARYATYIIRIFHVASSIFYKIAPRYRRGIHGLAPLPPLPLPFSFPANDPVTLETIAQGPSRRITTPFQNIVGVLRDDLIVRMEITDTNGLVPFMNAQSFFMPNHSYA